MVASGDSKLNLIMTGDIVVDHHLYEGSRETPTAGHKIGVRDVPQHGGAVILVELLKRVLTQTRMPANVHLGMPLPPVGEDTTNHHAYAFWTPQPKDKQEKEKKPDKQVKVWRTKMTMGYQHTKPESPCKDGERAADLPAAGDILVLDDAGFTFRQPSNRACWLLPGPDEARPRWIVLKMSQPVAQGNLWQNVVENFADHLVCVVSVDELRVESVNISFGLSWERSVEDVRYGLLNNPILAPLTRCRHLIVQFSADGALWLDRTDKSNPQARIVFDAGGAEGAWLEDREGAVFGTSATLTAAITHGIASTLASAGEDERLTLLPAIKSGLVAVRNLHELGHGPIDKEPAGFPFDRIAEIIAAPATKTDPDGKAGLAAGATSQAGTAPESSDTRKAGASTRADADPETEFADAAVPWPGHRGAEVREIWMIVENAQRPANAASYPSLAGLAKEVAIRGKPAFARYPYAVFGDLTTIDRTEIETLRTLRRLMTAYSAKDRPKNPLSIGVFGPPGAGKSFGVKQIAREVFGDKAWLEFNLSQFSGATDLVGAFHQVRDRVLSGVTPVVFWDEFDSKSYTWLQYLLAPMQDGRFQDAQLNHAIGKCVFVFAGGTSPTFAEFEPPADAPEEVLRQYRLCKGPDFHSRLDAYYDVVGPNRRAVPRVGWDLNAKRQPDGSDVCYPLRRAVMMRGQMGCKETEELDFDSDLLDALLLVPEYRHGARSLEKMVSNLREKEGSPIRRSQLPSPALIAMHVDKSVFDELLTRNEEFVTCGTIEDFARAIHENYRERQKAKGQKVAESFDRPYDDLDDAGKDTNRAAARRYPRILACVGAGIAKRGKNLPNGPSDDDVRELLKLHRERLAEEEHKGWMRERLAGGSQFGKPRDDARKIHDMLISYARLPAEQKDKDRDAIDQIPAVAELAGHRIVWLGQ